MTWHAKNGDDGDGSARAAAAAQPVTVSPPNVTSGMRSKRGRGDAKKGAWGRGMAHGAPEPSNGPKKYES